MNVYRAPATLLLWLTLGSAQSAELTSSMTVTLHPNAGEPINIATVAFEKEGEHYRYALTMDSSKFTEHFLSMRPFKCFQGPQHMLCHLPYPYEKTALIGADNLTDLEYDLLFIHRQASEYGINPWNGIYYKLRLDEESGKISGELREVDLDILATPPKDGLKYPIQAVDLIEVEPATHSYPHLVIEKTGD